MSRLLDNINSPEDIKALDIDQLKVLAREIREFLIDKVSKTGGHLASNLGVVELTLALFKVFDMPEDKVIWDVGHQSYVHKIITGRKDKFDNLRKLGGISGFPKASESIYDFFNTGHSSTSISAALGMAKARDIKNEKYSVIAVIGDGALTGGMAFEAMNDAGRSPNNLIVILNDNEMSIAKNVGGLSLYLSKIRTVPIYSKAKEDFDNILNKIPAVGKSASKALKKVKGSIKYMIMPGVIFEELGFKYLGPIDGHDINGLCSCLSRAKQLKGPVFIHIKTQKGKGYFPAEKKPQMFHGIPPFEIETGKILSAKGTSYTSVFGESMVKLGQREERLIAITAAMPHGTGLIEFSKMFPNRFFDVGIAEQHAVTFAAGMAKCGMIPVFAVYSSFLQRAYDQILHDVALQNLHVVFAIDRSGVVGEDGETHHGIYDLSYLRSIPGITVMAPSDYYELKNMLEYAVLKIKGPVAVRYPKGEGPGKLSEECEINCGKGTLLRIGKDVTIAAVGSMAETALSAASMLEKAGISAEVINARFVKPIDEKLIISSLLKTKHLVTIEDNVKKGGFGSGVLEILSKNELCFKTKIIGFPDEPVTHGSKQELYKKYGLDGEGIAEEIVKFIKS